tara:strand:+ start:4114 stop:4950 length:837 start_codon:yes stop_codon:yes gene_type:complete
MDIFLTGSTGFIGKNLKGALISRNFNVISINRKIYSSRTNEDLENFLDSSKIKPNSLLIHAAAAGVKYQCSFEENILINVIYLRRIINSFFKRGVRKFIILGSCFEYGMTGNDELFLNTSSKLQPVGYHSISKALSFLECKNLSLTKNLNLTYARLFQVYGEGENHSRLYPSLLNAGLKGNNFNMSEGNQVRDFTHVNDVVNSLINEIDLISKFQIINVCSGVGTSIRDFASYHWSKIDAEGSLLFGNIPSKNNDLKRVVGLPSLEGGRQKIKPLNIN